VIKYKKCNHKQGDEVGSSGFPSSYRNTLVKASVVLFSLFWSSLCCSQPISLDLLPYDSLPAKVAFGQKVSIQNVFSTNGNGNYTTKILTASLLPKSLQRLLEAETYIDVELKTLADSFLLKLNIPTKTKQVKNLTYLLKKSNEMVFLSAQDLDKSLPNVSIIWSLHIQREANRILLSIAVQNTYRGKFSVNDKYYDLFYYDNAISTEFYFISTDSIRQLEQIKQIPERYELNEPFLIDSIGYLLDAFNATANTVVLQATPDNKLTGYKENYFLTKESLLLLDTLFSEKNLAKDRFKLLYFWGEWCGPCLEKMPILLSILKKTTPDLSILFVAFVFNENLVDRTSEAINLYEIPFANHFNIRTKNDDLAWCLRVNNYPTYLLVSKEGKIVCRTNSLDILEQHLIALHLIK